MIQEVGVKEYRGRSLRTYWLTDEGFIYALTEGADPEKTLRWWENHYGKNVMVEVAADLSKIMGQDLLKLAYGLFEASNGKGGGLMVRAFPIND